MSGSSEIPLRVQSVIDVPLLAAQTALAGVLADLTAAAAQPPELTVDLAADLQMPVDAALSAKVRAQVSNQGDPSRFEIRLDPAARQPYYPHFRGLLLLAEGSGGTATLTLDGCYTVPLGGVGKTIDVTFLAGAASKSLQRFVDRLALDASTRAREEEERHARAALHFHV